MGTEFCIKAGYRENPGPVYFLDDVHNRPDPIVFQPDVLPAAAELCVANDLSKIIDVGCGQATKLAALHDEHPDWDLVGVDYGDNLKWCRDRYPWGTWIEVDLEHENTLDGDGAVIVASDVIEHLVDPRPMLATFRQSGAFAVVISTPERDVQHGVDHMGPSPNLCHVREWNCDELGDFLEQEGFTVEHMGLTRGNDRGPALSTILAVCK